MEHSYEITTAMDKSQTDYHQQAPYFAGLDDYSPQCGTDYLAVRDLPRIIQTVHPLNQILDYGCGSGLATRFLRERFASERVIGADINTSMLEQAKKADPEGDYRLITHKPDPTAQITAGSCDVVNATFVLHANPTLDGVTEYLTNCFALLRPGGKLLIGTPDKNMGKGEWATVDILYPHKTEIEEQNSFIVRLQPSGAIVAGIYWPADTLSNILKTIGFTNISIAYPIAHKDDPYPWKDELHLAPYFCIYCDKPATQVPTLPLLARATIIT